MNVDNAYYKKIIYKKNAFSDLKTYIKLNFSNKKILLVSSKSVPGEDVTIVLNSLFSGSEQVTHFVVRDNFNKSELDLFNKKILNDNPNLIVALGAGKVCDTVKYFTYLHKVPYVVCPTLATSIAYFTNYCINPYDSKQSFYANYPNKVFIQESIVKNSNLCANINGLCFLNALRSIYVEGVEDSQEKEKYIFVGIEKLFSKLDEEQNNILLCGEDANLILMDLFIDFGFFISMLNLEEFYLINMYNLYSSMEKNTGSFSGKKLLLCSKLILTTFEKYFDIKSPRVLEKPNYKKIAKLVKKYKINCKNVKNNEYFCRFLTKNRKEIMTLNKNSCFYKNIFAQVYKIGVFSDAVKSVYKYGIELDGNFQNVTTSLAVTPFIYGNKMLINFIAGSGVLNAFIY